MKTLTGDATTEATKQVGSDPIIILEIQWENSTTKYYSDQEFSLGGNTIENRIMALSIISSQKDAENFASVQSISFTLSDQDLEIKGLMDTKIFVTNAVKIYQHFEGNDWGDKVLLFQGQLQTPTTFYEADLKVDFNAISVFKSKEVGHRLYIYDIPTSIDRGWTVPDDAIGKPWPVILGNPLEVPTLHIMTAKHSVIEGDIEKDTDTVYIKEGFKLFGAGAHDFCINGCFITGTFSAESDEFDIANQGQNVGRYGVNEVTLQDQDSPTNKKLKLHADMAGVSLVGNFVQVKTVIAGEGTFYALNYCVAQDGLTCYFRSTWKYVASLPSNENVFVEVEFVPDEDDVITDVRRHIDASWKVTGVGGKVEKAWKLKSGSKCYKVKDYGDRTPGASLTYEPDTYIVNADNNTVITDDVVAVAHRTIDGVDNIVKLPTTMYTYDTDTLFGQVCTTISINEPFYLNPDLKFKDKIWVCPSAVGQNTATQIQYLVESYTDLSIDSTTFTAVATSLTNYPSNFALLKAEDAIKVIKEIAFQARCGLRIENDIVYLYYLSEEPSSTDFTLVEEKIEKGSMVLGYTETTDVYTRSLGTWKEKLTEDEERRVLLIHNDEYFGERNFEKEIFIYNSEGLVEKTVTFWKNRFSRPWKTITVKTFMYYLGAEVYDTVSVQLDECDLVGGGATRKGVVQHVEYDLLNASMKLKIWLPITCGSTSQHADAWMDDSGDSLPTDPSSQFYQRQVYIPEWKQNYSITVLGTGIGSVYDSEDESGEVSSNAYEQTYTAEELIQIYKNQTATMIRCKVLKVLDNYLICRPFYGNLKLSKKIYVAKPFTLQKAPFDRLDRQDQGQSSGGSDDDYYGIEYNYEDGTGYDKRTATVENEDPDDLIYTDYQIICPRYKADETAEETKLGDFIIAVFVPSGTGVFVSDEPTQQSDDPEIFWIDLNNDGRSWVSITKREYDEC
jgi:hypothetical protein